MLFPHIVTVYPSSLTIDTDGNEVRRAAETGVAVWVHVQHRSASATQEGPGQRSRQVAVVYLHRDAPNLDAWSRLLIDGRDWTPTSEGVWYTGLTPDLRYQRIEVEATGAGDGAAGTRLAQA